MSMDKIRQNIKSSSAGFGLIQAMVGILILGIISLTFIRKTANRYDIRDALQLVSYRDQVLSYYTSLASNRIAWRNTRGSDVSWRAVDPDDAITLKDVDNTSRIKSAGLLLNEDSIANGVILPSTC